jgi:uncharacterized cupin superfamily protein
MSGSVKYIYQGSVVTNIMPLNALTIYRYHSADYQKPFRKIDGVEVSRVLAYWRAGGYYPNAAGYDGYAATNSYAGDTNSGLHSANYELPAWTIDGTEASRVLAYWRANGYHVDSSGFDGYAPDKSGPGPMPMLGILASGGAITPAVALSGPVTYNPGETLAITATFSPGSEKVLALGWTPQVPAGWTIVSVSGDCQPELVRGEILNLSSTLPSTPIQIVYTVKVPESETSACTLGIVASYTANGMVNPATVNVAPITILPAGGVLSMDQTITFPVIPDQVSTSQVSLTATASSGLPVTFTVGSGPARITGGMLSFTGIGKVSIVANQSGGINGTNNWNAANPVTNTFNVLAAKADQAITFPKIPDRILSSQVSLAATASSGLPVTFTVGSGPAVIKDGTLLSFNGTGEVSIVASQAGDEHWNAAVPAINTFNVTAIPVKGIANADFDGDGLADPAIYDENTGTWTVLLSGNGYKKLVKNNYLGGPGWAQASADYDGDGKTDPAIYQESTGNWSVKLSRNGYAQADLSVFLGVPGWAAAAADYDGDGLADPAVWQASTGDWKVKFSTSGYREANDNHVGRVIQGAAEHSNAVYSVVSADYDGDGLADPAAYIQADGTWIVLMSCNGYIPEVATPQYMGGPDWEAVPGDYDGDGLADLAVRNVLATGEWRVMLSSDNYMLRIVFMGL